MRPDGIATVDQFGYAMSRQRHPRRRMLVGGTMAGDLHDANAVEGRRERALGVALDRSRIGGLPPDRVALQEFLASVFAGAAPLGNVRHFLVLAKYDNTNPSLRAGDLVNFDTDVGIGTHPFDLLPAGG